VTDPIEREDTDHGVPPGEPDGSTPESPAHEPLEATEAPEPTDENGLEEGDVHHSPETERPPEELDRSTDAHLVAGVAAMDPEATVNLSSGDFDLTVNLKGDSAILPERDDVAVTNEVTRGHLKGLLEALIFASDKPIKPSELAKSATAPTRQVKELLEELKVEYAPRGLQLDEVAGGWIFRTNAAYAPFVRDLSKQKPVKLTRAQIETLAILAYRQPITRPEVDEIRGVDCGPVLKVLLERDLVRVLGKKDEPGRPWLYGTTTQFLEFFGLKSLRDLPTLREFTDLNEESRRTVEKELGESLESTAADAGALSTEPAASEGSASSGSGGASGDTLPPEMIDEPGTTPMNTEFPPEHTTSDDLGAVLHASGIAGLSEESAPEPHAEPEKADTSESPAGELDPEEEFPDDDDDDFDDDDEEEDDDDDEEDEEEDA
jgi:segregation and condensation protein B